ncbi:MAG: hypothetical protein FWC64_10835 [Treponema sp.]|nr:hypothetical protein [Treponema sp.]
MRKMSVIFALAVLAAFAVMSCATAPAAPSAAVEVRDVDGNVLTGIDVVAGATAILRAVPVDAAGQSVQGEVTLMLGRYVNGELYIGDRFTHGGWGGIRVGYNRTDLLFIYLIPHPGRVTAELVQPGSYEFYIFAISGNAPMPNPPVHSSEYPYAQGATRSVFTVNVLP